MSTPSSSSLKALTTILNRTASTPLQSTCFPFSSSPLSHWNRFVHKRLLSPPSSSIWASKLPLSSHDFQYNSSVCVRKFWTFSPLCMGRRSCKIAGRKGAQDLKKAKLCSKIGKQVVSAIKKGGPNPASNSLLLTILEKAKELDLPKDIIERNIKRALEKGQEAYIEKSYEVYGYGGVGFVVEVSTDKLTRTVPAIREVVKNCGGKMADSGSVMFRFRRARIVNVKVDDAEKDQLLEIALDAGAEDVIEPSDDVDDSDEDQSVRYYKIVSEPENYSAILSKLRDAGIKFETDNGLELLPVTPIEVDDEAMELNKELMSQLLELDDVDAVYTDQK